MITRFLRIELITPVVGGLLTAIAVLFTIPQWGSVFSEPGPGVAIAVTALGGSLLATVAAANTSWIRASLFSTFFFIAAAGFWYNVDAGDLPGDLVGAWKALATTGLLLPSTNHFTIVPVVVTWIAVWLTIQLFEAEAPAAVTVMPIIGAHGVSIAYTVGQRLPSGTAVVGVTICCLLLMAITAARRPLVDRVDERPDATTAGGPVAVQVLLLEDSDEDEVATEEIHQPHEHEPVRWRQVAQSIPLVLLIALVGLFARATLPERQDEAFDLRERVTRPLDIVEAITPLARVKAGLIEAEPREVFTIDVIGLTVEDSIARLPVATLDVFDGSIWTSSARFEAAGAELPQPEQLGALGTQGVQQTVNLTDAYPFRFLPRVGMVTTAEQTELGWDPRSGSIARLGVGVDDRFFRNRATLTTPVLPVDADIRSAPASVLYATEIPPITRNQVPAFQQFLDESTAGATSELDRLIRVEATLASERFGYNTEAPAGHSMAALASYLSPADSLEAGENSVAGVGRIGFAEQSAAAFAVVSRQLGVPSRVVVGYRLEEPLTAENTQAVVNEDAIHAWPEVWINGVGWFAFEPTNDSNGTAEQVARTPAVSADTEDAEVLRRSSVREPILIPDPLGPTTDLDPAIRIGVIAASIPVIYLVFVLVARRIRRARRRSGSPAAQVSGAWREARDRLQELGLRADASDSVLDVAETMEERRLATVADPLFDLAPLVDHALYAPLDPHPSDARAAWSASDDAARAAARQASPIDRARATVNPWAVFRR